MRDVWISAAGDGTSTTLTVGDPIDVPVANIVHVGPEHPAARAFEEKLRTHRLVTDGERAWFAPR